MEDNLEESERRSPLVNAIIYGVLLIIVASIARLIAVWVNAPGLITSVRSFFDAAVDSFFFVLNFDFKVWWVFLFVLYLAARFYKNPKV